MARTRHATEIHNTPQKGPRIPAGVPRYIVLHHGATTNFDALVRMEMGGKQVSSTVIVKDKRVASMFDEAWRAWSLSSQYWDSVSLSSETCNESLAPSWTISEESHQTLVKLIVEWCIRYSIPCDRTHVMGHREVYTRHGASYATACPGGMDLDRLVRDASAFLAGGALSVPASFVPVVATVPQDEDGEHRYTSTEDDGIRGPIFIGRVQTLGRERSVYPGVIDNVTGPLTEASRIKLTAQALNGWVWGPHTTTDQDGVPGGNYWTSVQMTGQERFGYPGRVDGIPGPLTYAAENRICAHELNAHR